MTLPRKIKVEVRPIIKGAPKIAAKQKNLFACKQCSNRYYSFHTFCPQCLGNVCSVQFTPSSLKLISFASDKRLDLIALLRHFSDNLSFDFSAALNALPWTVFENSDPAVLNEWKRSLEPASAVLHMDPTSGGPKQRKKQALLLSARSATLPMIFPAKIETASRALAKSIQNPNLRLQWCETFLFGFRLVENFYKQDAAGRVLFSDLIYQIEQELQEAIQDHDSYYKDHDQEFSTMIDKLHSSLQSKQEEIEEVRREVRSRL